MSEIIELNICLCVADGEKFVEDNGSSIKAVVGDYNGLITLDIADSNGKHTYFISKQFARDLAKALQEKAQ